MDLQKFIILQKIRNRTKYEFLKKTYANPLALIRPPYQLHFEAIVKLK